MTTKEIKIPPFQTFIPPLQGVLTIPASKLTVEIPPFNIDIPDGSENPEQQPSKDVNRFNVRDFKGIGDGKHHALSEKYNTLEDAKLVFPGVDILSLEETIDWAAAQAAANAARDYIRKTLGAGNAIPILRTGISFSPTVYFPPGLYIINKPLVIYPHVSIEGSGWGVSILKLSDLNWAKTAAPMTTNKQGIMFVGPTNKSSALLWLQGDEAWPLGSGLAVAGMVSSVSNIGLKCYDGAAIFIPSNQNQLAIYNCWINGYGAGPDGLGIVNNNITSSTQTTNLYIHHNMMEGCKAAIVMDRILVGSIDSNQFESNQNGVYLGSAEATVIHNNTFTVTIPIKPFVNAIWVGLGVSLHITNNIINKIEGNAIKILGLDTKIIGNTIKHTKGYSITKSGFGILIVTPRQQFGGSVSTLGGQNGPHHITNNTIWPDSWPNPSVKAIFVDTIAGEMMKTKIENNIDTQI